MSSSDAMDSKMMHEAKAAFDNAANGKTQLRPEALVGAFSLMKIKITEREGERILRKFDLNNNAGLEKNEFLRCARSAHPPLTIACKFNELLEPGRELLNTQQARKLLQNLGHIFSAEEADKLVRRSTTTDDIENGNRGFTLEDMCRLTSAALVFLHENPIPPPNPAAWNELVLAMHTILGAFATSVLVFFALKQTAETQSAAPTPSAPLMIPFLHHLSKGLDGRFTDVFLMCCLSGWGGFHMLSLALRGSRSGKVMDCLALACGMLLLSGIISFVNPWLVSIPALMFCLVGVSLWVIGGKPTVSLRSSLARFFKRLFG